jgi:predicted NAD-dependent protein-ADP-ribosyltransferase YbiA (DUF1768 family)
LFFDLLFFFFVFNKINLFEKMSAIVYFNSSSAGSTHLLSNLNLAPITLTKDEPGIESLLLLNPQVNDWLEKPLEFPTIEHLWHALKATEMSTFLLFAKNGGEPGREIGRFAQFNAEAFVPFFKKDHAPQKFAYWKRKDNWGIIPKLAANPKYCSLLLLNGRMKYEREMPADESVLVAVWQFLLRKKYENNEKHRNALLATGSSSTLVEFSRSAAAKPDKEFWGGLCKEGRLHGRNFMGQMMQMQRDNLFKNLSSFASFPILPQPSAKKSKSEKVRGQDDSNVESGSDDVVTTTVVAKKARKSMVDE